MIVSVYGAGYVGLVSAACLAKLGHQVICADINKERIAMLLRGECPIYEEQLPELLQEQQSAGRLHFTSELSAAIKQATIHIIAVGTPGLEDDSADLSQVFAIASMVAEEIEKEGVLVTKSTVPVGTGDVLQERVDRELRNLGKLVRLDVASNPEFLREGTAVYDFLNADRIVLGGEEYAVSFLQALYQPLVDEGIPLLTMSRRSAELTKYSANAMLACKISFMNQMSQIAEKLSANIDEIRQGISLDHRIGPYFLQAGIGYGGSCFPKDVRALVQTAKTVGIDADLLQAVDLVNQKQKHWVFEQLLKHFAEQLQGLTIGIWGLAFKPGTDDLREASSLVAMKALLAAGAKLAVFDPVAMPAARQLFDEQSAISWCDSAEAVLDGSIDALVIATEWPQFKACDLTFLAKKLGSSPLIDGRNCFELAKVIAAGFACYYSVGRPPVFGLTG